MATKLKLFCIVEGELTSFSVTILSNETIDDLKKVIKAEKAPDLNYIASNKLTLELIPGGATKEGLLSFPKGSVKVLDELEKLSTYFPEGAAEGLIHIIVKVPQQAEQPQLYPCRPKVAVSLAQLESNFSRIEQEFYSENWSEFIEAYVAGEVKLPVTDGAVAGFPRAWSRKEQQRHSTKPSLLFVDFTNSDDPNGSNADFDSMATAILSKISEGFSLYPIFGASGCGKTRTVMNMLSQNWGFYLNASRHDRGSDDVDSLISLVTNEKAKLTKRGIKDPELNSQIAKSMTICLLLARLSILLHCLSASKSKMTPRQWMLLQVCPQVFGEVYFGNSDPSKTDLFLAFFTKLSSSFINIDSADLIQFLQNQFRNLDKVLIEQYQSKSKFLLVLDEAQVLGPESPKDFKSEAGDAPRPLLSPFYHGLEAISEDLSKYCIVACGTGFCIYDLAWIKGTGIASKVPEQVAQDPKFKTEQAFPRWDDLAKVETYLNKLIKYLVHQGFPSSASKLSELIDQQARTLLFAWFRGRLRPMISVIENVIQRGEVGHLKALIKIQMNALTETGLMAPGNLCFELQRIPDRTGAHKDADIKSKADIRENLRTALKERLFHSEDFELNYAEPVLVDASFARIVARANGKMLTIIDEPIAFQAAFNFFEKDDAGLLRLLGRGFSENIAAGSRGSYLEYFSPALLIPIFHGEKINPLLFKDGIKDSGTQKILDRTYSIVGHDTGLRGTHHEKISMGQFLYAHCKTDSIHNTKLVAPFFYPPETPSGPDVVFVLESENQHYPVFIQSKISGSLYPKDISDAHRTVCCESIEAHLSLPPLPSSSNPPSLADFCSGGIFFSLLLLPNCERSSYSVAKPKEVTDSSGRTLTQYTIIIDKDNMETLASPEVVDVLKSAINPLKRTVEDIQVMEHENGVSKPNSTKKRKVQKKSADEAEVWEMKAGQQIVE